LPPTSNARRVYCSAVCRVKQWNLDNPGPDERGNIWLGVPLHWHWGDRRGDEFYGYSMLAGDGLTPFKRYWRGQGCPPSCPRPPEPPGWSCGIPPSKEGLLPPSRPADWAAELETPEPVH
jgi:hypothetical protein